MKNCKDCRFCKKLDSTMSPGGMAMITNYTCNNEISINKNTTMNKIVSQGKIMDSRDNNGCDKHTVL